MESSNFAAQASLGKPDPEWETAKAIARAVNAAMNLSIVWSGPIDRRDMRLILAEIDRLKFQE